MNAGSSSSGTGGSEAKLGVTCLDIKSGTEAKEDLLDDAPEGVNFNFLVSGSVTSGPAETPLDRVGVI